MNAIVLAVLAGVFGTLAFGAVVYGSYRFAIILKELITGLKAVATIATTNKELVEVGRMVAMEVQLLRSMMAANVTQQPGDAGNPREGEAGPTTPQPRPPFPTPPADFFREVPDAKESDTEIIDTTDEQLVAMEKLEEIRKQGYEADPAELEQI